MRHISKAEAVALIAAEAVDMEERFEGCAMCAMVAALTDGAPPGRSAATAAPASEVRVGASAAPRGVLASNAAAVAMLDRFAARPGHVVVVLRRHVESLAELPWEEYAAVQRLAWEAARALTRALTPARVYVAALGSSRRIAISFPHHHVHVIPLPGGGAEDRPAEVLTWRHGVHVYEPGEIEVWAERLRAAWPERAPAG